MEIEAVELLGNVGQVLIPPAVATEVEAYHRAWHRPKWVQVTALNPLSAEEAEAWFSAGILDMGEAEALALARQSRARLFFTDDAAAALLGRSLGIEIHGSLGIVLWNVARGHISHEDGRQMLERLAKSSLWISQRIMAEAFDALARLKEP